MIREVVKISNFLMKGDCDHKIMVSKKEEWVIPDPRNEVTSSQPSSSPTGTDPDWGVHAPMSTHTLHNLHEDVGVSTAPVTHNSSLHCPCHSHCQTFLGISALVSFLPEEENPCLLCSKFQGVKNIFCRKYLFTFLSNKCSLNIFDSPPWLWWWCRHGPVCQ